MLPRAFLREKEFDAEVKRVEKLPGGRVARIRYSLDYDSTGDPCVKFRINSYHRYRLQSEQETMQTPAWA